MEGLTQRHKDTKLSEQDISAVVVDASVQIHKRLGPGLLEHVYETVLAHELTKRGLTIQRQVVIPIVYDELTLDEAYRADIVVNDKVILELKSVEKLQPVHKKQLLTYLKLRQSKLGLLLNFGSSLMVEGIHRIINGHLD